ncbi:MAG: hypothetical protein AB1505_31495 [Candidatus Latescibacterota bacterium]
MTAVLDGTSGARIAVGARSYRVVFDPEAPQLVKIECEGLIEEKIDYVK